jgi:hypothetical protein
VLVYAWQISHASLEPETGTVFQKENAMTRRIPLSLLLTLSALLSLGNAVPTVKAQQEGRNVLDSGIVVLGPNRVLRMAATGDGKLLGDVLRVRFRRIGYSQGASNGGVSKYNIAAQDTSDPVVLASAEGASIDIPSSFLGGVFVGVRGMVLSDSAKIRVIFQIINTSTGAVECVWDDTDIAH